MPTTYTDRLLAGMLLATLLVAPVQAQDMADHDKLRLVSISGEGVVRAAPDQAIVRFGIVMQAMDPEEARSLNATAAREAMNAVRDLGIDERKMRLESLRLQPAREYDPDTRRYKEVGFEASRQVVVELDDLDTLPTLVAQIVQKGANRLDQVTYDLQDRDAARNQALVEAITNARDKATLLATTLGESLGRVQSINEQSFDFPRPTLRMEQAALAMAKDEAAPEPEAYAAGEIEVRATVQVVFALE